MMKKLLLKLLFIIFMTQTAVTFGQASFEFIGKPAKIHPNGTLAPNDPFVFVIRNVPNGQSNVVTLRLYPYVKGVVIASGATTFGWQSGSDKINMTLSSLNSYDVNNGFFKTETVDNGNGTFTKTYTVFNVSKDVLLASTAKNGGMTDGISYAPIVRIIQANAQPLGTTGLMATGDNPFVVDQASLDRSPDYVNTSFAFSYYPPEENNTTGAGEYPHVTATSTIDLYNDGTGSGKQNQIISFVQVGKKYSTATPFTISATSSSGLTDITYSIVSGPAAISGNTVTLSGTSGGIVTIKGEQAGNSNYNKSENYLQFEVVDLSIYKPTITTRLTEDYPLQMPSLYAYPIYISSNIDEPSLLSIDHVEIIVNDKTVPTSGKNGVFFGLWTPDAYGLHTVKIISYGTNGTSTTITKNIQVTDAIINQNVKTMNGVVIEYNTANSNWYYGKFTMPQHVGSYDRIIGNLLMQCPSTTGDCDDWDRLAYIDVMGPDGNWIQIIRYVTPYGVGCSHTIDLTDYASLLQGVVQFRMYIATYGTGGWQISLDFDFQKGTPQYLYSKVDELWDGSWEFGNPTSLQPVPLVKYTYGSNILSSHLRLSTTGHGWGSNNSQNAAEFYHATHFIDIDGTPNYTQDAWRTCNPNPDSCTGQKGTWTYNRAGWCPGAISPPDIVDMTSQIAKGTVDFSYRFDPTYVDYCHPNNPNCVTGVTCTDCNDTFIAQYVIDGQLINFSNTPLVQATLDVKSVNNTANYKLLAYPNPSNGIFHISSTTAIGKSIMRIISVSGEILKSYYIDSIEELNKTTFNLSSFAKGLYFVTIDNNAGQGTLKLIIK